METKFGFTKGDVILYRDHRGSHLFGVVFDFQEEFKNIIILEGWLGEDINTIKSGGMYGMRASDPSISLTYFNLYQMSPERQLGLYKSLSNSEI